MNSCSAAIKSCDLPVIAAAMAFSPGHTITIDGGANQETAVISSVADGGRGGFGGPGRGGPGGATITVAAPLKFAHAAGAQLAGSGITLNAPLTRAHDAGAQVAGSVPTPGAPNQYSRRRKLRAAAELNWIRSIRFSSTPAVRFVPS
jgi:non-reducing end alpha-L-arabinofuranosidase